MSLTDLVAHLRRWLSDPIAQPKAYYARYLDQATRLTDTEIADIIRFAKTTRGAQMALVHHIRSQA